MSLSGAPLAKSDADPEGESVVEKFLDTLGATLEPVYGFRSLHAFKSKFQPRLVADVHGVPGRGATCRGSASPSPAPTCRPPGVRDMIAVVKH